MCDEAYYEAQRRRVKKLYAAKHIGLGDFHLAQASIEEVIKLPA